MESLRSEISAVRNKLSGVDDLGAQSDDTSTKVCVCTTIFQTAAVRFCWNDSSFPFQLKEMELEVEEIQEKLWELDKSWQNNLVFYGVKSDAGTEEHPSVTEAKIREIIKKNLQVLFSRESDSIEKANGKFCCQQIVNLCPAARIVVVALNIVLQNCSFSTFNLYSVL